MRMAFGVAFGEYLNEPDPGRRRGHDLSIVYTPDIDTVVRLEW